MTSFDGGGWDVDPHGGGVRRCGHCGTVGARLLCAAEVEQVLAVAADRIAAMGQTPPGYNLSTLLADALRGCERDAERRNPVPEGDDTRHGVTDALGVTSWLSPSMVDVMLHQIALDRGSAYWTGEPHGPTLDAAETWLRSLRDFLAGGAS